MPKLKKGDKAPHFEGLNQNGEKISLDDFAGKKLILYFYPKDNTPGCTAESCNLNENYDGWLEKGYEVVGVSPDSVESHKKFADKFDLQFNLIADTEKEILQNYGAWGEKNLYGKKHFGVLRKTFIIDRKGRVEKVFEKVTPEGHGEEVLAYLRKARGLG